MSDRWRSDVSNEELFPDITFREHVLTKDMWAGSKEPADFVEYIVGNDGRIKMANVTYSPAMYKCLDEAIVNALDHVIRMHGYKGDRSDDQVTRIDINFGHDGMITVRNNGMGVPTDWHTKAKMYIPQLIFGNLLKGMNVKKDDNSITGGTNGVGIKLANIFSTKFAFQTIYKNTFYSQKWTDNMKNCDDPIISKTTKPQYTQIEFMPDYEGLFQTQFNAAVYKNLKGLFKYRAYMAAAYAGWVSEGQCAVTFNGKEAPVKNIYDIAALSVNGQIFSAVIGNDTKFPWHVCVGIHKNSVSNKKHILQMSNVNSVNVTGGKHIEYIADQIINGVKENITKILKDVNINFQPSYVYNNIFIFINAQIPGVNWGGQRKDEAGYNASKLKAYKIPKNFIDNITSAIQTPILETIHQKMPVIGAPERKTPAKKRPNIEKFEDAENAGKWPHSRKCSLLIPEGDSAAGMCRKGITHVPRGYKKPVLGFEYYGMLTTRGVIMNVRKATNIVDIGGVEVKRLNKKLTENKFFNNLIDAVGLNVNHSYDPNSPTYNKEIKELRYGCIIGCVDQDLDGGFIFSLIINMFDLYWPHLLASGFIKRFITPVRRAYPKNGGKILEFYSDFEYDDWAANNDESKYKVKYIKGLGTNSDRDTKHMFENFKDNLFVYIPDKDTPNAYNILFSKDAEKRRELLKMPQKEITKELIAMQRQTHEIKATDHAIYEVEPFKRDNLRRKLWCAIDGLNESGRKILSGSLKAFRRSNEPLKVYELGAKIAVSEKYHHGPDPLNEAIFGKGFICVGGVQLPFLIPHGNFGTRAEGGADHASPRYPGVNLNKRLVNLLYPPADMNILPYEYSEGVMIEPRYFVPIIPMAILESVHCPADGWKIKVWARNVFIVIRNVKYLIRKYDKENGIDKLGITELPPEYRGFKGKFRQIRGNLHSFGIYTFDKNTRKVSISELPLRVWHVDYEKSINKRRATWMAPNGAVVNIFADPPRNKSNDENIDIVIYLENPNNGYDPIDIIESYADEGLTDGFEEYFALHNHMDDHLNMMAADGHSVIEFENYKEILRYWFPYRKDLYIERINREIILAELNVKFLENLTRYVAEYKQLGIMAVDEDIAVKILVKRGYQKFNKSLLENPGITPTSELRDKILDGSYDYLLLTTDRDKLNRAIENRAKKLETWRCKLEELRRIAGMGQFPGAELWLQELAELEKVIIEGQKTDWLYDDADKYNY